MVTEYMAKGSLVSVLRDEKEKITTRDLLNMAKSAAAGMSYLEGKGVIHRDLAARNLLVRKEGKKYLIKVVSIYY